MRVVIDSTILVSIFSDTDKFHKCGLDIFSKIIDKKIEAVIPTFAVPETCGMIGRVFDKHLGEIVEDHLNTLIDNGMFSVKELTLDRMRYSTEDAIMFGLKGADAVFVALTKEMNAKLATFDQNLKDKIKRNIKLFEIGK